MKKYILIIFTIFSLFFAGCSTSTSRLHQPAEQKLSFPEQINQLIEKGFTVKKVDNPNLTLPLDINSGQIENYFKIGDIFFALVLRTTANIAPPVPNDFSTSFAGVLVARQGDIQWTKLTEVKDTGSLDSIGNNPYYLTIDNKTLLIMVVDTNGGGSGEGIIKVFAFLENGDRVLQGCFYLGYSNTGGKFAFSKRFGKQETRPMDRCKNVQLIMNK